METNQLWFGDWTMLSRLFLKKKIIIIILVKVALDHA